MENRSEIEIIILTGTAVMLFLAFALILLGIYYQNLFIGLKRREAEMLLQNSLEAEKKERYRIAADLHDGVQGDLSAVRHLLSVLQKSDINSHNHQLWEHSKEGIENAISTIRQISYNLMPPLLEDAGLLAALKDYYFRLNESIDIQFTVQSDVQVLLLGPIIEYNLFRVIQELTANLLKHNYATTCKLNIVIEAKLVVLHIIDDGIKYNFNSSSKGIHGVGLGNIEARLKAIDGRLQQLDSRVGNHLAITLINNAL